MLGPSLNLLQKTASDEGFSEKYSNLVTDQVRRLTSNGFPAVLTLMHLCRLAGAPWTGIHGIVSRNLPSTDYSIHHIRKRSGGFRTICVPTPILKVVQSWIHEHVLKSPGALRTLSQACTAYKPEASIIKNAEQHAGCAWMVKVDITDFFESVSERQVFRVFEGFGYAPLLAFEMARLCTRVAPKRNDGTARYRDLKWRWTNSVSDAKFPYTGLERVGFLPQGAPTSPLLSNLVVRSLDSKLAAIASEASGTFTRYADDIVVSFYAADRPKCQGVFERIARAVRESGFRLNSKKSYIRGPGCRKVVTGLCVNDDVPRLTKPIKDKIELAIYFIKRVGLLQHAEHCGSRNPVTYLNHLHGLLVFAHSVDPKFAASAEEELSNALAPYSEALGMFKSLSK